MGQPVARRAFGQISQSLALTPEQIEIRELKKRIERLELEKEVLKIPKGHTEATALLMSDSMNISR